MGQKYWLEKGFGNRENRFLRVSFRYWLKKLGDKFRAWLRESIAEGERMLIERKQFTFIFSFLIIFCRKGKGILIEKKQTSFISFLMASCRKGKGYSIDTKETIFIFIFVLDFWLLERGERILIKMKQSPFLFSFLIDCCREFDDVYLRS